MDRNQTTSIGPAVQQAQPHVVKAEDVAEGETTPAASQTQFAQHALQTAAPGEAQASAEPMTMTPGPQRTPPSLGGIFYHEVRASIFPPNLPKYFPSPPVSPSSGPQEGGPGEGDGEGTKDYNPSTTVDNADATSTETVTASELQTNGENATTNSSKQEQLQVPNAQKSESNSEYFTLDKLPPNFEYVAPKLHRTVVPRPGAPPLPTSALLHSLIRRCRRVCKTVVLKRRNSPRNIKARNELLDMVREQQLRNSAANNV